MLHAYIRSPRVRLYMLVVLLIPNLACYAVVAGAAAGGLTGAALAPGKGIHPGNPVEVTLRRPRDLLLFYEGGRDTSRFYEASFLSGHIHRARGDTLWVAITRIVGKDLPSSFPRDNAPLVALPPDRQTDILSLKDLSPHIIGGAAVGGLIAFLIAFHIALQDFM